MVKKANFLAAPKAKRYVILNDRLGFISEHKDKPDMSKIPEGFYVKLFEMDTPYGYKYNRIMYLVRLFASVTSFQGTLAVPVFLELYYRWITSGVDEFGLYVEIDGNRVYSDGFYSVKGVRRDPNNAIHISVAVEGYTFRLHVYSLIFLLFHNHGKVQPAQTPGFADFIRNEWVWRSKSVGSNMLALLNLLYTENMLTSGLYTYDSFLPESEIAFSLQEVK